jgi:hypothetical protein
MMKFVGRLGVLALTSSVLLLAAAPVSAAHAVRNHGSGTLNGTWDADFDAGMLNSTVIVEADMAFNVYDETHRWLGTYTGNLILKMGSSRPSYATCAAAPLVSREYNVKRISPGTWFCFKTGEGHFVRFRVDAKHPYPGGIELTWTTWEF